MGHGRPMQAPSRSVFSTAQRPSCPVPTDGHDDPKASKANPRFLAFRSLIVALALTTGACTLPAGDNSSAESLYYAVVQARQSSDVDRAWQLLDPQTRALFDQWVAAERGIVTLVSEKLPTHIRDQALSILTVQHHSQGRDLFATLLPSDRAIPLEFGTTLGAHVRTVEVAGDQATIRSWGGNSLGAVKRDDRWFLSLPPDIQGTLKRSHDQAVANLERLSDLAKRLKR